ncbi:MAG: lipid-A-disaccharide synthase [Desulfuromonadaceae bacterium]|nr:lipid-A-disaccharide synthase [Desulfuromonadaceae bacterium]MDD5104900.1 lipid-A-disaccharide synthase [Desulfuromonadaceae bacterium]
MKRIMIVAGEASGDIYGADLVHEMRSREPKIHFFGIGGQRMREAGVEILVDSADMAVMGLVEVFSHFAVITSAFRTLKNILIHSPPTLLIVIDYPGFNLRLAKAARKAGVKVLYYISPKVWAWKAGRIKTIASCVDHLAAIFPFEVSLYEKAGVPVTFVGHPLLDLVKGNMTRNDAVTSFGLDPSRKIIGLFPGSRKSEIEQMLPTIFAATAKIKERFPGIQFILPIASTLQDDDIIRRISEVDLDVTVTHERIHDVIRSSDAIISVSGTVTLEIALVGTPMVIIYKLSPLTYQLAKRLVKIPHIGLCNIVAGETIVRELIQDQANPEEIASEIGKLLTDCEYHATMVHNLSKIREKLGCGGASANVARLALSLCGPNNDTATVSDIGELSQ